MRTKTLAVCAALAAGALSSMAQSSNVYSLNIVGYANVTLAAGPGIYANPFNLDGTNSADKVLRINPVGQSTDGLDAFSLSVWNGSGFTTTYYESDFAGNGWTSDSGGTTPTATPLLPPGLGFFLTTQLGSFTNTFVGNVVPAPGTTNIAVVAAGSSIIGSVSPVSGSVTNYAGLQLPQNGFNSSDASADAYNISQWNGSGYTTKYFESDFPGSGWTSDSGGTVPTTPPSFGIGEGFFISTQLGAFNWPQSITNSP